VTVGEKLRSVVWQDGGPYSFTRQHFQKQSLRHLPVHNVDGVNAVPYRVQSSMHLRQRAALHSAIDRQSLDGGSRDAVQESAIAVKNPGCVGVRVPLVERRETGKE
jgi:hypothetical protein